MTQKKQLCQCQHYVNYVWLTVQTVTLKLIQCSVDNEKGTAVGSSRDTKRYKAKSGFS